MSSSAKLKAMKSARASRGTLCSLRLADGG